MRRLAYITAVACASCVALAAPSASAQDDPAPGVSTDAAEPGADQKTKPRSRPRMKKRKPGRQGAWKVDDEGRIFRVAFPLYERVTLEANTTGLVRGPDRQPLDGAWRGQVLSAWTLDYEDDEVWWALRHTFADVSVAAIGDGAFAFDVNALDAIYLRHDLNSFILTPLATSLRIPAPFDLAMEYDLGRVRGQFTRDGDFDLDRVDVLDAALLADFIRDERFRRRFAIGVAGWYQGDLREGPWRHEIAPFTAGRAVWRWDQRDGLFTSRIRTTCGAALWLVPGSTNSGTWRARCFGDMQIEWTPIAIRDQPISLPLEVEVDAPLDELDATTYRITLGLRISLSRLRRPPAPQ